MKNNELLIKFKFLCLCVVFFLQSHVAKSQCEATTPSFTVNLTSSPTATYISPSVVRNGTCCGSADPCVKFVLYLHPTAMGVNWGVIGADPAGSLIYQSNCGTILTGGTPVCLNGPGPHTLTICKVGGNANQYQIVSLPQPKLPDSIMVRNGCTQTLSVSGFSVPTIKWNAVNSSSAVPNYSASYNGYLSCTSGCSVTVVTPTNSPPAWIDYEVSGYGQAPCTGAFYRDTVRVYFYSDLLVSVNTATICAGQINAVLTATGSGGKAPLTYSWSTGSTAPTVTVGAGTYTVRVADATGCPPTQTVTTVSNFTLPITVTGGPDRTVCKSSPAVSLSRTVTAASGASWTASGSGSFAPTPTSNPGTYNPSPADLTAGSVQLYVTTTGNSGCPEAKDTVNVSFQNFPIVQATPSAAVCANFPVTTLTGTISNYPASPTWSTSGSGTLSTPGGLSTTFTAGSGAIAAGSVSVVFTSTNNGVCPPASATTIVYVTPSPSVYAGSDRITCNNTPIQLSGSVTLGATTGSWSSTGNGTFSNPSSLTTSYTPGTADISTGSVSIVLKSTNNGNCLQVSDTLKLSISPPTTVNVTPPPPICSTANFVMLSGTITGASNTGTWSTGGNGGFATNSAGSAQYNLDQADRLLPQLVFTLTSTNNTICPVAANTVTLLITQLAAVNAGTPNTVCSSQNTIALNGSVFSSANTASWSSSGSGAITNNSSLNTTYSFSPSDVLAGFVNFTLTSTNNGVCPAMSNSVAMYIRPMAVSNAGTNSVICSNMGTIPLAGSVTGGTNTGLWAASGSGTFSPGNNQLSTSYLFSQADITAGSVIFTLTSSSNSPCAAHADSVKILITPMATVSAGANQSICSNNTIGLGGSVTSPPGTAVWTSNGSGSLSNPSALNATYTPALADINNGLVIFTITSTGNGVCPAHSDTVMMRIWKLPIVNAGASPSVCSSSGSVALTGTVISNFNTGVWSSSGTGNFNPNSTSLNTAYILTPADTFSGSVAFILTSTDQGSACGAVDDTVIVSIFKAPVSVAGSASLVCSTQNPVALTGSVSGSAGTGSWTASGSGSFPGGVNNLSTTYSFTSSDILNGSVIFTLSSTNNGPCASATNTMLLSIKRQATVTAGPPQSVCSNSLNIPLSGTVSGGNGTGVWSTAGTGSFSPGNSFLSANYLPSSSDVVSGNILLTLKSSNDAPCAQVQDTLRVRISTPATANTGTYGIICSRTGSLQLNGNITGGSQAGMWSANGTGTFSPSPTALSGAYLLSPSDIANGVVNFSLTTSNNGACPASTKTVAISIRQQATVTAVADKTICSTQPVVTLGATISGGTNSGIWISNGTGTFTPDNVTTNAAYNVSKTDINTGEVSFLITSTGNGVCAPHTDTMRLRIIKNPVISMLADTTICSKERRMFISPSVINGSGSYKWVSTGTGYFEPNDFSIPSTYVLSDADALMPAVKVSLNSVNNGPCGTVTATYSIFVNPSPKADFAASLYTISLPSEPVIFTNLTTGGGGYLWDFGDGTRTTTPNPKKSYTEVGFYTVTLSTKNEYNCTDTVSKQLTVIREVLVPTAFTPNGDNLNGVFKPMTGGVVEYDLMIFNRWGELIFRSEDINTGWDGTFNGKPCQQDAYVWKAKMTFFDGRIYNKTGSITLLR